MGVFFNGLSPKKFGVFLFLYEKEEKNPSKALIKKDSIGVIAF